MAEPAWLPGKRAAQALRLEEGLGFGPVDVWEVIRRRGVQFALHDFGEAKGDGLYIFGDDRGLIIVNTAKRSSKQRFTAAHELGHHELHRFDEAEVVIADKNVEVTEGDPAEIAANAFAAYLLAPDEGVRQATGTRRNSAVTKEDVVGLMRRFGLSYAATVFRLLNAGCVNKANADRLREEAVGEIDALVSAAGFNEDALFPPGSELPPMFLAHAMALYQHSAISAERLGEILDVNTGEALNRAGQAGYARGDGPEPLNMEAAAALLEE